jgi:hypothetical protein
MIMINEIPNESHSNRNSPEKEYGFDIELFEEIIPEVRAFSHCVSLAIHRRLGLISTPGE